MTTFDYLRQSAYFFKQNFFQIAAIQAPFLLILNGIALWLDINAAPDTDLRQQAAYLSILSLTFLPIYWGGTILYMQSRLDDTPMSAKQAIYRSLFFWRSLLFTFILTSVAVFTGLLLIIIPGIYIGVRLSFADYICVVERQTAIQSLKLSWDKTDNYFWVLLQGLLILFPALQLIEMPITRMFAHMENRSIFLELPIIVFIDLLGALITVYGFRIYCVMRNETEKASQTPSNPTDNTTE